MPPSEEGDVSFEEIDYSLMIAPPQDEALNPGTESLSIISPIPSTNNLYRICLPPDTNTTNHITNELFQVTSNLRTKQLQQQQQQQQQKPEKLQWYRNRSMYYNHVWKPQHQIQPQQQIRLHDELLFNDIQENNFEMDDVNRTKVFQKRLKRPIEEISPELRAYFYPNQGTGTDGTGGAKGLGGPDEDKENSDRQLYKIPKKNSTHQRLRSIPLIETNNMLRRSKSMSEISSNTSLSSTLAASQSFTNTLQTTPPPLHAASAPSSPKRFCQPRHQSLTPSKPNIHYDAAKIFLIESLTGLVKDATSFATELNGLSYCELPYPDNENEVIQIPTNSDHGEKTAIIRMFRTKLRNGLLKKTRTTNERLEGSTRGYGFYSEAELQAYKERKEKFTGREEDGQENGVLVLSQSPVKKVGRKGEGKKHVRWAAKLEW